MLINHAPTQFPELNQVLIALATTAREMLGTQFIGAYLQGSFALGGGDMFSDCDFLIVYEGTLGEDQIRPLREMHNRLPTLDGHWTKHLEGSYADAHTLRTLDGLGTRWLYVDHGSREAIWHTHCNTPVVRWTLRECGITLVGPPAATLVDAVPDQAMRDTMREEIPRLIDELNTWVHWDIAWCQRYAVATFCRMLYTLRTARVAYKAEALRWAIATLDARWRPLLQQVLDDRARDFDINDPPRHGSLDATFAFADYVVGLVGAP